MTTKVLDLNNIERKLFWAFASFFAIAISFYLYSVLSLTLNVVERDRTASAVRELAAQTGALEAEYLGLQNSVTLAYAEGLGLKEVAVKFAGNTGTKISLAR
ncbi:MAG: hypothetical protein A2481_04265 [Candidatus Yonathbacteria bacterium RIFOXYC2_FULL_47_9]|nr:MAG: hypothetical protein A2481_04265 [Candidatus Yonathbacteria bacterium RIFOXYC2_FULL_47_9]HAT68518.1 hypothetical protein [Candidatus Yonathbacteria bacterium]